MRKIFYRASPLTKGEKFELVATLIIYTIFTIVIAVNIHSCMVGSLEGGW